MDGKGDIPTWAILTVAFLYPLYHIFDILDGKHARNTKQSSPLGLLVDHGCDAITTFLFTMSLGSIFKLEGAFWYTMIWFMASINFFLCTWEEYITDRLDFPMFHGVSEGTFIASAACIFTAIVGQNFWTGHVFLLGDYWKLNNLFVGSVLTGSSIFGISNFKNVYKHEKTTSFTHALSHLSVFFYMIFSILIVIFYSKSEIIENYPKVIVYVYGFCFSKLVVNKLIYFLNFLIILFNYSLGTSSTCTSC